MTTLARSRRARSHRKGDRNEQAILQTAERLLAKAPLADVTVEALARGAGISRSSFYFYFGSKEDVLLSLLDRLAGEIDAAIAALDRTIAEDPITSITAAIESSARVWRDHGPVLHAVIEAAGSHDAVRAAWHATMRRPVNAIAATIRAERARAAAPEPDHLPSSSRARSYGPTNGCFRSPRSASHPRSRTRRSFPFSSRSGTARSTRDQRPDRSGRRALVPSFDARERLFEEAGEQIRALSLGRVAHAA